MALRDALSHLSTQDLEMIPVFLQRYVAWMQHYVDRNAGSHVASQGGVGTWNNLALHLLLEEVDEARPQWMMVTTVARNLLPILKGEVDPLQLVFDTNLAKSLYTELFDTVWGTRLHRFLELATHQNPKMEILEVGAGTGAFTSHIMKAFQLLEKQTGGSSFAKYSYTDISPAFFESAKERFHDFEDRIEFSTLDMERNIAAQGFQTGQYDVVVVGSVLHATVDLVATIRNVRQLLKPGGYLLLLEITAPEQISVNFAFGVLPGWWSAKESWRKWCPVVDEDQWDRLFRENGFSRNEMVLKDYNDDNCHFTSIIASIAQDDPRFSPG